MSVRIVSLFPDLLGTYGDGGNAVILAQRLRWRDIDCELLTVSADETVPDSADIYLLGGGEDGPQSAAAQRLNQQRSLHRAVENGATVFAVCAGMQILGESFPDMHGKTSPGLGLLDCQTLRVEKPRAVGELLTKAAEISLAGRNVALGPLSGFENHAGRTRLGSAASPLAAVEIGEGNGDGYEGIVQGNVVATYLHGPVFARNPDFADAILSMTVGELSPIDDEESLLLRAVRIDAARRHELTPKPTLRLRLQWRKK